MLAVPGYLSCSGPRDELRPVAEHYGLADFEKIESIEYTFAVTLPDRTVERRWLWKPGSRRVTLNGEQSYDRAHASEHPDLDQKFINDVYWLLFPIAITWAEQLEVSASGLTNIPNSAEVARHFVLKYPDAGGYTPGDVYEIWVNEGNEIVAWLYRKGGVAEPTRYTTWEDTREVGPFRFSLDRKGASGFRVQFRDLRLKMIDGEVFTAGES